MGLNQPPLRDGSFILVSGEIIKLELTSKNEKPKLDFKEPEKSNGSPWLERPTFRITLLSTFAALAVVIGYMLVFLPNIELFTLMIFLAGFILGKNIDEIKDRLDMSTDLPIRHRESLREVEIIVESQAYYEAV